jgi:coenzyme F420-dependent glucose-6-phosphate dehydrogenase
LFTEKIYTPKMSEENGKAVGADTIRQSVRISADPDVHVKFARRYIDLGFNHLIFHAAGPDHSAFIEQYGRHGCRDCRKLNLKIYWIPTSFWSST